MQELERKLLFFQNKLGLTDLNVEIRNSRRTGVHFDDDLGSYLINYNETGLDYFLAHELGHILLSKKTNCPIFSDPPSSNKIDETIFSILDYLINVIVNSLVSRTNNLYEFYKEFFIYYINLNFKFNNKTELVAFIISSQLEYQFNLRLEDKSTFLLMKMTRYHSMFKTQPDFDQNKYDNILLNLNNYKKVIKLFDLQEILNFLFEITRLICENFNYMDEGGIKNQFQIFFP
ncbi:hypothetical protein LCGC14_1919650 [marine sediment metagenome]|uniref:IrrE N-terminal-like domain-containing protein n=1 Tax=marine sediment metagenome TaxID=412755 RepID=A0A0F9FR04_9ZZZZ